MGYQGWTNEQTWCVALTLDNNRSYLSTAMRLRGLKVFCASLRKEIVDMAPWAWPDGYDEAYINWDELKEHYKTKRDENGLN